MRMPVALTILLAMTPPSFAVRAAEAHIDAADFTLAAQARLGERVTVDNCHLVFATGTEATCIGLAPQASAGDVRPPGRLLIRLIPALSPSPGRWAGLCEDGAFDDACHVSVTGVVEDLSGTFGIADRQVLGLRDGTVHWPD